MKLKKFLTEENLLQEQGRFNYNSPADQETHRTLESIIKNNGIFKSGKQQWYLLNKRWAYWKVGGKGDVLFRSAADVKKLRGVNVQNGDYVVEVGANVIFGKRGAGQGTRWLTWLYVVDDAGVKEKYKLAYKYEQGGAAGLDLSKTKREWTRPKSDAEEEFMQKAAQDRLNQEQKIKAGEAQLKNSQWIGVIGERQKDVEVEVLRKHWFETRFGGSSITVMKDKYGNMIHHWGQNDLNKGDKSVIDFTVKDHEKAEVNQWNKIPYKYTSVSRVKVK